MSDQHYCLRWNNYQSNMTSVFHQLLRNEDFVDVTLACNDLSLKAHKSHEMEFKKVVGSKKRRQSGILFLHYSREFLEGNVPQADLGWAAKTGLGRNRGHISVQKAACGKEGIEIFSNRRNGRKEMKTALRYSRTSKLTGLYILKFNNLYIIIPYYQNVYIIFFICVTKEYYGKSHDNEDSVR
ncbi:hypothetical protein HHI36_020035 [Cryptolaemus montrouzieri]|uniref:Uncharacterized protein n=1 Tax=Cryptolaemus montrouzieri TaxID=559131 RepID=A0ABD2N992_9CUCU